MRSADSAPAAAPPSSNEDAPRRVVSRAQAALIGAAVLVLAALTLAHPSSSRMHTWPWVLMSALLWFAPVALVVAAFAAGRRVALPAGKALPITVGLVVLTLGSIGSALVSPFSPATVARVWPTLAGVALFFVVHHWLSSPGDAAQRRGQLLVEIFTLLGAGVLIISVARWVIAAWPQSPWGSRNTFPFGHSLYTGGFLVLLVPWFAHAAWQARGVARGGWTLVLGLALGGVATTSSRGATIALAIVASVSGLLALRFARWPRRRKCLLVGSALAIVAGVVLANPRLLELARRGAWSDAARESNRQRSAMIAAGVHLGLERPILGWGPGSVPLAYPKARSTLDGGVENVLQLHNTPVHLWATLGAAGVAAAILLCAGATGTGIAALRSAGLSAASCAAAASLSGYGLFSLTDHQLDVPIFTAIVATNLAVIAVAGGSARTRTLSRRGRFAASGVSMLLLAAPLVALTRDMLARHAYEEALRAIEADRLGDQLAALDRATHFAPYDPFFQHQAAAALLQASHEARDSAQRVEMRRQAMARLEHSLRTGVHAELAHFNLGWLQLEMGNAGEAARHLRAAAALVPDKGGVYFGLGLAWQQAGRRDAAIRAFALEWVNDPRAAFSPAWEVPALAALRPAVRAETMYLLGMLRSAHPQAEAAERWMRWWIDEAPTPPEVAFGFSQASAAFATAWPSIRARAPVASGEPWAQLYAAWRRGADEAGFLAIARKDAAFAAALARRARRHPDDFRAFLAAGTDDEPALLRTLRRQRVGYGVLALHPEGPPASDVYIVQENRMIADFAATLFPPKGWLPGRFLLASLPPEPR